MDKEIIIQKLERRLERERAARKQAERILEDKALELFRVNEGLEDEVNRRTIELRQSETKYRSIIENMQLGILEVDRDEVIVRAFPLFCEITGYQEEELVGKLASEVLAYDEDLNKRAVTENIRRLEGEASVWEARIKHAAGHPIHMLVSGAPILDVNGEVQGSIGIHYDISYQKALQEELEVALEKAESAQRAEKEFLTNMSHEIRTPLNVIIGMTELLSDTNLTHDQQEYLNTLSRSADMLLDLISDILDISKIDAGVLQIHEGQFDLNEVVRSLVNIFEAKLEGRPLEMISRNSFDLNSYVIGDAKLLNQVLVNLLGNAAKFTEQGEVALEVITLQQDSERIKVRFSVRDTGIGISDQEKEDIFKQFKQAHRGINKKYGGSGLGLAISSRIINALGGELLLESEEGVGSNFYFDLEYKISDEQIGPAPIKAKVIRPVALPTKPILVVEDNVLNQKYLLTILDKWKLPHDIAENGQIAIDKMKENQFSLVLMDIQMPILDGYKATNWIRTKSDQRDVPIVALSASTLGSDKDRARQKGFSHFLSKPYRPEDLNDVLIQFLGEGHSEADVFLDQETLQDIFQGDEEYKKDIFSLFADLVPKELAQMKECITKEDRESVGKIAHKLKPNFHMVGLLQGELIMKNIESMSKSNADWSAIVKEKNRVDELLEKAWKDIERVINT